MEIDLKDAAYVIGPTTNPAVKQIMPKLDGAPERGLGSGPRLYCTDFERFSAHLALAESGGYKFGQREGRPSI